MCVLEGFLSVKQQDYLLRSQTQHVLRRRRKKFEKKSLYLSKEELLVLQGHQCC